MADPGFGAIETPHLDAVTIKKLIDQEELDKIIAAVQPEAAVAIQALVNALKTVLKIVPTL